MSTCLISTCQLTSTSCAKIEEVLSNTGHICDSCNCGNVDRNNHVQVVPAFNVANKPKNWVNLSEYNVPTFGPIVSEAVVDLFNKVPILSRLYQKYGAFKPLSMAFDDFALLKKTEDVAFVIRRMQELAEERKDDAKFTESVASAAALLNVFVQGAKDLYATYKKNIIPDQWFAMVKSVVITGDIRSNLHFDKVIGLFTNNQDVINALAESKANNGQPFNGTSTRWISSMLYPFRPSGPLCDIVNTIFAVMGEKVPENVNGVDLFVASKIDEFTECLLHPDDHQEPMKLFNCIMLDGEIDDMGALAILEYLEVDIRVITQLPTKGRVTKKVQAAEYKDEYKGKESLKVEPYDEKGIPMLKITYSVDLPTEVRAKLYNAMAANGFEVFFDERSANYSKLVEFWPWLSLTEMTE